MVPWKHSMQFWAGSAYSIWYSTYWLLSMEIHSYSQQVEASWFHSGLHITHEGRCFDKWTLSTFPQNMRRGATNTSSPCRWVRISPSTRLAIAMESAFICGDCSSVGTQLSSAITSSSDNSIPFCEVFTEHMVFTWCRNHFTLSSSTCTAWGEKKKVRRFSR